MKHEIKGQCHCGNIRYVFKTDIEPIEIPLRTCGCTFCLRQNGIYTSDPKGALEVAIQNLKEVNSYRFGHETADFHVCRTCGIMPVITSEIEDKLYGIVNLCTTGEPSIYQRNHTRKDFESETSSERLDRRKKFWIPDVIVRG